MREVATESAVSLNFDSLGWSLDRDPRAWRDRTFFEIADRFFELSNRSGFRYTIFLIGRDLENPEVRARVADWAQAGHELANHSYNHHPNLGGRPLAEIEDEVGRAHDVIAEAAGREPVGFIAPGWSLSPALIDVLLRRNYLYDTSMFPSPVMWAILAKLLWNFRRDRRRGDFFPRSDLLANWLAPRAPYLTDSRCLWRRRQEGLLSIPLPTTGFGRIPCWHTASFVYPEWLFRRVLDSCLAQETFYYVVHPADLADLGDLDSTDCDHSNLERIEIARDEKRERLSRVLDAIVAASARLVTLEEMARRLISERAP